MSAEKRQPATFAETARNIGADKSDDALDRAFDKLDLKRKPEEKKPETPKKG